MSSISLLSLLSHLEEDKNLSPFNSPRGTQKDRDEEKIKSSEKYSLLASHEVDLDVKKVNYIEGLTESDKFEEMSEGKVDSESPSDRANLEVNPPNDSGFTLDSFTDADNQKDVDESNTFSQIDHVNKLYYKIDDEDTTITERKGVNQASKLWFVNVEPSQENKGDDECDDKQSKNQPQDTVEKDSSEVPHPSSDTETEGPAGVMASPSLVKIPYTSLQTLLLKSVETKTCLILLNLLILIMNIYSSSSQSLIPFQLFLTLMSTGAASSLPWHSWDSSDSLVFMWRGVGEGVYKYRGTVIPFILQPLGETDTVARVRGLGSSHTTYKHIQPAASNLSQGSVFDKSDGRIFSSNIPK